MPKNMLLSGTAPVWTPAIEGDLDLISVSAFEKKLREFYEWSESQPPVGPLPVNTGWCDITPEISENLLRRNKHNRNASLQTVRKYAKRMGNKSWRPTGQPILISDGELFDGQHRLLASYFGNIAFRSFVIADVPIQDDLFAFIDDGKSRTAADALHTAGENGLSSHIAAAVKLAVRYDNHTRSEPTLRWSKVPAMFPLDNIEVLTYARNNPELSAAYHELTSNYPSAVTLIKDKGVAGLAAWKIISLYGYDAFHAFMEPLGSGANLDEGSPILGLRNRLMRHHKEDEAMNQLQVLALVTKGFYKFIRGVTLTKHGLSLKDNDKFPLFEDAVSQKMAAE